MDRPSGQRGRPGLAERRWVRSHTVGPGHAPWRVPVLALMALVVLVQIFVWGSAPARGDGGALLPGLRAVFGIPYGIVLVTGELLLCAYYGLRDGAVVVLVAAAVVDVFFWLAAAGGLHVRTGAAAALTAGFSAIALGAALLSGRVGGPNRR